MGRSRITGSTGFGVDGQAVAAVDLRQVERDGHAAGDDAVVVGGREALLEAAVGLARHLAGDCDGGAASGMAVICHSRPPGPSMARWPERVTVRSKTPCMAFGHGGGGRGLGGRGSGGGRRGVGDGLRRRSGRLRAVKADLQAGAGGQFQRGVR